MLNQISLRYLRFFVAATREITKATLRKEGFTLGHTLKIMERVGTVAEVRTVLGLHLGSRQG